MALDSLLVEIMVVGAPLLVVAATAIGDIGGIVAMACSFGLAAVFARTLLGKGSTPEPVRRDEAALPGGALLRNRRFLFWLLVSVAFGHSLGTVEIGSLAISHRLDSGSFEAAMLLAALAGASITGGLAYGTLAHRLRDRLVPLTAAFLAVVTVMVVLIALIQHWIPLVVSFLLLGLVVAPLSIIRQQATERETPVSQRTEAFATLFAGNALGFALAGLVLAVAPLTAAMALGASTSLLALVLIPLLVRTRDHRARMA
jgi:predicted MFS family arabinose efflux permease